MAKVRNEAELRATLDETPTTPPEDVTNYLKTLMDSSILIFKVGYQPDFLTGMKHKAVEVHCTHCGETYYLDYTFYVNGRTSPSYGFILPDCTPVGCGMLCECPMCGHKGYATHTSKIPRGYNLDTKYYATVHNVRGNMVYLTWGLQKNVDKYGNISYRHKKYEGIFYIDNVLIRATGYSTGMFGSVYENYSWEPKVQFMNNLEKYPVDRIFFTDGFENCNASHSAFDVFCHDIAVSKGNVTEIIPAAYFKLWNKYPQIENLVRNGQSAYVNQIILSCLDRRGYYYHSYYKLNLCDVKNYIDVKKKKPHEMLSVPKEYMPYIKGRDIHEVRLFSLAYEREHVILTDDWYKKASMLDVKELLALLRVGYGDFIPPVIRTINYLMKFKEKRAKITGNSTDNLIFPSYVRDYWRMLAEVYDGKPPKEMLYPNDIVACHDRMVLLRREKEDKQVTKGINDYSRKMQFLSYTDKKAGLLIRPAESQAELIKEGKLLNHCVATYAKSMSSGKTCILFIRHTDKPDVPYFTLEYRDGLVIQNRGKNNCARTNEVKAFEKKWLNHIKRLEIKENGKQRSNSRTAHRAGA